jgi:phosphoserine phosphatase
MLYSESHDLFYRYLCTNISEKIKTIIIDHKKKGQKIVFITRMISPIAKLFADYAGADYWLAENPEEKALKYTGALMGSGQKNDKGEQAKELAKILRIRLRQSFAYGHDLNDLPFLRLVKYKNIINPPASFLDKIEQKDDYEIIRF